MCVCVHCVCSHSGFLLQRALLLNFTEKTYRRSYIHFGGLQMRMWFWLLWLNIFSLKHSQTQSLWHTNLKKKRRKYIRRLSAKPHTKYSSQKSNWFKFSKRLCFKCLHVCLIFFAVDNLGCIWLLVMDVRLLFSFDFLKILKCESCVCGLSISTQYYLVLDVYFHSCQNSRQSSLSLAPKTELSSFSFFFTSLSHSLPLISYFLSLIQFKWCIL